MDFSQIAGPLTFLLRITITKIIEYLLTLVDAAEKDGVDSGESRNVMIENFG